MNFVKASENVQMCFTFLFIYIILILQLLLEGYQHKARIVFIHS